jgi:hypothetical protein
VRARDHRDLGGRQTDRQLEGRRVGNRDDEADPGALALDDRVGREGRGQRDQLDAREQRRIEGEQRLPNAGREVLSRGRRLGLRQERARTELDGDGVSEGPAGVDADTDACARVRHLRRHSRF